MQQKIKKVTNAINEELKLDESEGESDKYDEYQHIYDRLH